jgi:septal ring factor EnvC (AmiA/AmiB activator)
VVYALVKKDVPIVFLDFPRLVQDADYLYRQLQPILSQVSRDVAIGAHMSTAQPDLVRLGKEIAESGAGQVFAPGINFPDQSVLDRAALFRELENARATARQHRDSAAAAIERRNAAETALASHRHAEDTLRQQIAALEAELSTARQQAYQLTASLEQLQQRLADVLSSRTWRATYPVRALVAALKRAN